MDKGTLNSRLEQGLGLVFTVVLAVVKVMHAKLELYNHLFFCQMYRWDGASNLSKEIRRMSDNVSSRQHGINCKA